MPQERKTRAPNPEAKRELRGGLKDSRRSREKKMGEHQGRAGEEKSQCQEGTEQERERIKKRKDIPRTHVFCASLWVGQPNAFLLITAMVWQF